MKPAYRWTYGESPRDDRYVRVEIPDGCSHCEPDMDTVVTCPGCGCELPYGDCYTSLEYHDAVGFGYGVCEDCYAEETARRREAEARP